MTSIREPAIIIRGVSKEYTIGSISGRTLQNDLQSWWAKRHGKADPNIRLGFDERLIGKRFMALRDINLYIYKGERIGVIGVNGAGKSTLLKLISRITAPTEGDIDLYGRVASMLEVGTGFHGELTGRENIYMNGAILGMTKAEIDERMEEIIEFSEIREFIDTPVKRYSSGMFVKLAFSVAAHLNAEILIMDEVLAVGDISYQRKCLAKMRLSAEEDGKTVLYVSHNMNTIRNLCDRCIVLDEGKIIYDGEVDKAIAIYVEHSIGEDEVDIDLNSKSRGCNNMSADVNMLHLKLIDKASPCYVIGEDLRLALTVESNDDHDNIVFRLTFRNESDVAIGTIWAEPRSIKTGINELEYTIPLGNIMKGVFYVSIGICMQDVGGTRKLTDHIARAFRIDVLGPTNWNTHAYGYIEFKENSKI